MFNICNVHESFEHLIFECLYACKIWSIFLGSPCLWNYINSFSWSLAGYVDRFDSKFNSFWFALTIEVLWTLWKDRNKEIFQTQRRKLTEFNFKLTHFNIMLQVSLFLQITRLDFMRLVCEGCLMIKKDQVQAANYVSGFQSFLAAIEMDELNKYISEWQLRDVPQTELPRIGWENMYNQEQDQVDVVQSSWGANQQFGGGSVHNHKKQGLQHDGWNTVPSQDNR